MGGIVRVERSVDLDYLRGLGCNWLWFQPIHPNGIEGREIDPSSSNPYDPGSPYAVKNFFEVNEMMSKNHSGSNTVAQNRAASMSCVAATWSGWASVPKGQKIQRGRVWRKTAACCLCLLHGCPI